MGKALLSLFGSFTILTIDLMKPFKRETVTSMMEAFIPEIPMLSDGLNASSYPRGEED